MELNVQFTVQIFENGEWVDRITAKTPKDLFTYLENAASLARIVKQYVISEEYVDY